MLGLVIVFSWARAILQVFFILVLCTAPEAVEIFGSQILNYLLQLICKLFAIA
jgi:hypothetical protein